MKNFHTKAFTLIELLVVVAIIGILASVIAASVGGILTGSDDQAIKQEMNQMRAQAEIYKQEFGRYNGIDSNGFRENTLQECLGDTAGSGTVFLEDEQFRDFIRSIAERGGIGDSSPRILCSVGGDAVTDSWAIAVPLTDPDEGTTGWCVDSFGTVTAVNLDFTIETQSRDRIGGRDLVASCPIE